MIKGMHTMFFSSAPEALREFFRDKLGLMGHDVGQGWLIFDLPEADLGVHPTDESDGAAASGTPHLSFYCDDLAQTMAELAQKGVTFVGEVEDQGWGLVTRFTAPGNFEITLYQPRYSK